MFLFVVVILHASLKNASSHCVIAGCKSFPKVIGGFVKRAGVTHLAKMGSIFPRHSTHTTAIVDFPSHRVG